MEVLMLARTQMLLTVAVLATASLTAPAQAQQVPPAGSFWSMFFAPQPEQRVRVANPGTRVPVTAPAPRTDYIGCSTPGCGRVLVIGVGL
jgi:hypothetical protein